MPTIELPIRSLSILFLFGAIVAILWFPDNPSTPDLAHALFWWFLALGVVKWIENALFDILPLPQRDDYNRRWRGASDASWNVVRWFVALISFGLMAWFLILGIQYFLSALHKL
jgi:hypothetical protein